MSRHRLARQAELSVISILARTLPTPVAAAQHGKDADASDDGQSALLAYTPPTGIFTEPRLPEAGSRTTSSSDVAPGTRSTHFSICNPFP